MFRYIDSYIFPVIYLLNIVMFHRYVKLLEEYIKIY
jgi:hypothetical protein